MKVMWAFQLPGRVASNTNHSFNDWEFNNSQWWQEMEYFAFVHFSLNTYSDQSWGYGNEDVNQLTELLSDYGPIFEVWFDGANGGSGYYGGTNETRTIDPATYYDWSNAYKLI